MDITLGGGCFWCLDAVYRQIEGVTASVVGYAGGDTEEPDYKSVCSGSTGHAEVVQVAFDESVIGVDEILDIFFSLHDPTTVNRQGADVGTQYRSIVLTQPGQEDAVRAAIERAQAHYDGPIVTQVEPLEHFWVGEDYHQDYFAKNPAQGYCAAVVAPKVAKMRQKWAHRVRA